MAKSFNQAIVMGNLTRDPELRTTPSGQAVASFAVATNRTWVDGSGERKEAVEYHEIVRLRDVFKQNYDPVGKAVVNESGQRLGKVENYTINLHTFMLQKLYVHQSLMKSLLFNNLVVDRTQIIDVTDKQITVRDASVVEPKLAAPAVQPK